MDIEAAIFELLSDPEKVAEIREKVERHKVELALFGETTLSSGLKITLEQ